MPDACDALDRWIDAHFDDEVRFLQALVRVPTDTPPGDNTPHARRTRDLLAALGFEAELHEIMPQAMLFVRGENAGISHNPLESSSSHDIDLCAQAFQSLLDQLALHTS